MQEKFNEASRLLGAHGENRFQNFQRALELLHELNKAGHVEAVLYLGRCYKQGVVTLDGTRKGENNVLAFYYFQLAARRGNKDAMKELVLCYTDGIGIKKDEDQKRRWQIKIDNFSHSKSQKDLALQGDISEFYGLLCQVALWYRHGIDVPRDLEESLKLYLELAGLGYADAQFEVGYLYHCGIGVPEDPVKAKAYFELAAVNQHVYAMVALGLYHEKGVGTGKNPKEAVKCYTKASELGSAEASFMLGLCHEKGVGTSKNPKEAVKCYTKASELGSAEATRELALCLMRGIGVKKNVKEAVRLMQKAAEQGDLAALYELAAYYDEGLVGDDKQPNPQEAERLRKLYLDLQTKAHPAPTQVQPSPPPTALKRVESGTLVLQGFEVGYESS